ncbi:MAG: opacity protein-like surface antigen [Limisphaerales bacterium]|jgi:opacity protein-like surface antigen
MNLLNLPKIGLVVLPVTASTTALAEDKLSYDYIQATYIDTEIDDRNFNVDGDGLGISGSVSLNDNFFVNAGYASQEFDRGVDVDQWSIGLGGHMPLSSSTDLVGTVSYVDSEVDARFGSIHADGYGLGLGVRSRIVDNIELEAGINYVDLGDGGDDTSVAFGGRYYFTEQFSAGAGVQLADDVTNWNVGIRLDF